jgi:hypothetical protein
VKPYEASLPIKREWFDAINFGDKTVEFREASAYWRARLLNKAALNVRLVNGRGLSAPFSLHEVTRVEVVDVAASPAGLAPAPGTPAHAALFRGTRTVIAVHLGDRLEFDDPRTGRVERFDPSRAARTLDAPPETPPEAAGGGDGDGAAAPPLCRECGARCAIRESRSASNFGRAYYKCAAHEDAWVGWAGRRAGAAKTAPAARNIGRAGESYADVRAAEREQTAATAARATARNDGGGRGNVFGFADGGRGPKRVISKERERKDPSAFAPVNMDTLLAAKRPAPDRDPEAADHLRKRRLARFG